MTNSSPWKDQPMLLIGKPSISIRAIFHGNVKQAEGTVFFCVFTTPFASKMNHFGGLKLVNCLQFGLLSAPIVSRIAYTMSICLPFVRFVVTKQTKHNKQTKTQQQKQCVPLYSGLWTSCQIFGFLFFVLD